eukprot:277849-Prymnesium_polylepis.1
MAEEPAEKLNVFRAVMPAGRRRVAHVARLQGGGGTAVGRRQMGTAQALSRSRRRWARRAAAWRLGWLGRRRDPRAIARALGAGRAPPSAALAIAIGHPRVEKNVNPHTP